MKAAAFEYVRCTSVEDVLRRLEQDDGAAKLIAGGQSLAPMLNLRLARPSKLIDISRVSELRRVDDRGDHYFVGAAVTHAEIEDGIAPDVGGGLVQAVARTIAYRAVRNRGTIGGSLAHCDPAADWLLTLTALDATIVIAGIHGQRRVPVTSFMIAAFTSVLSDQELVLGIEIAKLSKAAQWGHRKFCRKVGKFADAAAVVVVDPERGYARAALGHPHGAPLVLPELADPLIHADKSRLSREALTEAVTKAAGDLDAFDGHLLAVNLVRTLSQMSMQ